MLGFPGGSVVQEMQGSIPGSEEPSQLQSRVCVCVCVCVCVLRSFSCVRLFMTLWTVAHQALPSMGFSRQEDWRGLPCPPPGDLPDPGIEPTSVMSPALADGFFTTSATWEAWLRSTGLQSWTRLND